MTKRQIQKTTITIRVPSKLLSQFLNTALEADEMPMEVIVDFMRSYVAETRLRIKLGTHHLARGPTEIDNDSRVNAVLSIESARKRRADNQGRELASKFFGDKTSPYEPS